MWNVQCNRKYLLILHENVTGQQSSCKVNISVRRTGTGTKIKLKIQINWKKVISIIIIIYSFIVRFLTC